MRRMSVFATPSSGHGMRRLACGGTWTRVYRTGRAVPAAHGRFGMFHETISFYQEERGFSEGV